MIRTLLVFILFCFSFSVKAQQMSNVEVQCNAASMLSMYFVINREKFTLEETLKEVDEMFNQLNKHAKESKLPNADALIYFVKQKLFEAYRTNKTPTEFKQGAYTQCLKQFNY